MATQLTLHENGIILRGMVHQWDRRLRFQQTVYWLPRALMPGLVVGILLAVISRTRPWLLVEQILTFTIILLALGLIFGGLAIWLWRRSPLLAARRFDVLLGLDERTSTALELLEGRIRSNEELLALQLEDARLQARAAHVRERLPLRSHSREWGLVLLLGALLALLLLLPNPQADLAAQTAEQAAAIEQAAEELRQITEDVAANANLSDPEREQLLEVLDTSTETLQQQNVTPEESFATISDAQSALQNQADRFNQRVNSTQGALNAAAEQLRDLPGSSQTGSQDAFQQMMQALQEMTQNMQNFSPGQGQQAAQQLSQAAQTMQNSNPQASQAMQQASEAMQQASEAMQNGDQQQAQQNLQQAQQDLQQQAQQQSQQQQAAQQMNQQAQNAQQAAQQVSESAQQQGQQQSQQPQQGQQAQQSQQSGQQQGQQQQGQQQQGQQQAAQQQGQQQQGQQAAQQSAGDQPQQSLGEGEAQDGQSMPGDGQQQGQQAPNAMSGAALSPGSGSSAGDEQGSPQQGQQSQSPNQNNNPDGQGESEYEPIYVPQRIGEQPGGDDIILEPDSSDSPVVEDNFTENPTGNVTVPYNQVFSNYQNAANQALDSGYIPLGLKDIVRNYFTSLEPGQ